MSSLRPYSTYSPAKVSWLEELPSHWTEQRIGVLAELRVSNVDKLSRDAEVPVRLCNYVDVYKNDRIDSSMSLMRATASPGEVERFRLEKDDVLITKDSEAWNDIGVPALVNSTADDLISGYHLALLKPKDQVLGRFLAWVLRGKPASYQFHIAANGVTRYGLTHTAIRSVTLPTPPLEEQAAIVRHLDDADQRIREYVSAKERLIALLEEERQAVIHQAVTRGLDPNVRLKPSGVEWLGDMPKHWGITQFGRQVEIAEGQADPKIEPYASMTVVAPNHVESGTGRLLSQETAYEQGAISGKYICRAGDVIYSKIRPALAKVIVAPTDCLCSADMYPLRPRDSLQRDYLFWLLLSPGFTAWSFVQSDRVAMPKINRKTLNNVNMPLPPLSEQVSIAQHLFETTGGAAKAIERARLQIELMEEYRNRLIADVVTGKIDVREANHE